MSVHSTNNPFVPIWSGFDDSSLRPILLVARDGSGYRPVSVSELGSTLTSGISITGIIDAEQVVQIAGSGDVNAAPKIIVDSQGRITVLSTLVNSQVGVTGSNGSSMSVIAVSGYNSIPVFIASGSLASSVAVPNSPTVSGIRGSGGAQTIILSDSTIKGFSIFNATTERMLVRYGTGVSFTSFSFIIDSSGYYESSPNSYNGAMSAIWEGSPVGSGFITTLR